MGTLKILVIVVEIMFLKIIDIYKKLIDKRRYYNEVKTAKDVDNIKDNEKLLLDFAKKLLKISSSDMEINGIVKERIRNFNIDTILK
jgi:hypothetical protein